MTPNAAAEAGVRCPNAGGSGSRCPASDPRVSTPTLQGLLAYPGLASAFLNVVSQLVLNHPAQVGRES